MEDCIGKLKSLREGVNFKSKRERVELVEQLYDLIEDWKGQLPNLRDIFRPVEIDWLIAESLKITINQWDGTDQWNDNLFDFVVKSGYKDMPIFDENGKVSLRRTTPVHCAKYYPPNITYELLKIYGPFSRNYTDKSGYTYFHAASICGDEKLVENLLGSHDPNCIWRKTGESPLHLALDHYYDTIVKLLLRGGACPNLADKKGFTPLHILCQKVHCDDLAEMFFEIVDEKNQLVPIDARDKLGRTPLQLAVAKLLPKTVDLLINRGADLSNFVFPTENDFYEFNKYNKHGKMKLASGLLVVVERLEKRGYALDRSDALVVMKFFAKYELFATKSMELVDERWYDDEDFARWSKDMIVLPNARNYLDPDREPPRETRTATTMSPSLRFHDLVRMPIEEGIKLPTYYYEVASWCHDMNQLSEKLSQACTMHLCETMLRGFFRGWALDCFWELINDRLPILCCEIIIKKLKNEDLFSVCLAVMGQSS